MVTEKEIADEFLSLEKLLEDYFGGGANNVTRESRLSMTNLQQGRLWFDEHCKQLFD